MTYTNAKWTTSPLTIENVSDLVALTNKLKEFNYQSPVRLIPIEGNKVVIEGDFNPATPISSPSYIHQNILSTTPTPEAKKFTDVKTLIAEFVNHNFIFKCSWDTPTTKEFGAWVAIVNCKNGQIMREFELNEAYLDLLSILEKSTA